MQALRELSGQNARLGIPASKDRMAFKNISLYITDLPPTPKRFRDKYTRTYSPRNARKSQFSIPELDSAEWRRARRANDLHRARYASGTTASTPPHLGSQVGHPQTYQMGYVPKTPVSIHPSTYGFEMFSSISTKARFTTQIESDERGNYPGTAHTSTSASGQTFGFHSPKMGGYDEMRSPPVERERSQLLLNPINLPRLTELGRYFIRPT
jgi:hypothetical protein